MNQVRAVETRVSGYELFNTPIYPLSWLSRLKLTPLFGLVDPLKNAVRRARGDASMNGCSCALRWPEASFTGATARY
ncbi:hypothetical protein AB7303_20715 [Providencia rettgeri]